jgi:hypothetical protein
LRLHLPGTSKCSCAARGDDIREIGGVCTAVVWRVTGSSRCSCAARGDDIREIGGGVYCSRVACDGEQQPAGACECGEVPSDCLKCFFTELRKEDSASRSRI